MEWKLDYLTTGDLSDMNNAWVIYGWNMIYREKSAEVIVVEVTSCLEKKTDGLTINEGLKA